MEARVLSSDDRVEAAVESLRVAAFTIPTDEPESDGTLKWDSTTIVVVEVEAGGQSGLGYTYGDVAVARFIESNLATVVAGRDALCPPSAWAAMQSAIRNAGRPGVGAMAISAVDIALWDLKSKLLDLCLADALPRFHAAVPIYGSGGFTSYSATRLREQLEGWMETGLSRVKVKVGRDPGADPRRLSLCREVIGEEVELMVDANGAFEPKQALGRAGEYADFGVGYLEEPVSSEDRAGLRLLRERGPAGMAIAAGEYEWDLPQFADLAGCVDIMQADVTRVGGITNSDPHGWHLQSQPAPLLGPLRAGGVRPRLQRDRDPGPPRVLPRSRAGRADALRRHPRPAGRSAGTGSLSRRARVGAKARRSREVCGMRRPGVGLGHETLAPQGLEQIDRRRAGARFAGTRSRARFASTPARGRSTHMTAPTTASHRSAW